MPAKALVRDAAVAAMAPLAAVAYRERPRVRVIAFHDTPREQENEFRERLRRLADRRRIVSLADAADRTGLDHSGVNVVLTFDDGLKEHVAVAAGVLDALGLPATFFVPTGALDLSGEAAAEYSHQGLRRSRVFAFMSTLDVQELAKHRLFAIGAHTHSHPDLGRAPDLDAELSAPKRVLEEITARPVRWLAYPFGNPEYLSAQAVAAARGAGYEQAFTIVPAFWSRGSDPFLLGRDALSLEDSHASWDRFLRGGYDALSALKYRGPLRQVRGESAVPPV